MSDVHNMPDEDDFNLDEDEIDVVAEDADEEEQESSEELEFRTTDIPAAKPARESRENARVRKLADEAKALRAELAETRRRQEEMERRQAAPPPIDPRVEAERIAMMTPDERMSYQFEQSERRHQQQMAEIRFAMQDQADRVEFKSLVASNPRLAKLEPEVEAELQKLRASGSNVSRTVMARYIIGQRVLSQNSTTKKDAKAAGADRIRRQQVAPGSSKGDEGRGARGGKSLEDRLADKLI